MHNKEYRLKYKKGVYLFLQINWQYMYSLNENIFSNTLTVGASSVQISWFSMSQSGVIVFGYGIYLHQTKYYQRLYSK